MQIDFTAIDNDLNKLPRSKANSLDIPLDQNKEATVEDDIAISEAIAQIEKELKGKQPELPENLKTVEQTTQTAVDEKQEGPFSLVAIILFIAIGALTAKFALKLF